MDQEPSTSRPECLSPRRKRPRAPFSATEKLMVRNVFKYVWEEKAAERLAEYDFKMKITTECIRKTADILGISVNTVFSVLREHKGNQEFKPPAKTGPKRTFKDKLSAADFEGIRRKIKEVADANETPSITKVHQLVVEDPTLPNFSRTTMRRVMAHLKNTKEINCNAPVSNSDDNNDSNGNNDKTDKDSVVGDSADVSDGTPFELIEVKVEFYEDEDDDSS